MSGCPFTALYRDWSDRKRPWVLIERTAGGFQYSKILVEIPNLEAAIEYVAEHFDCPPEHWTEVDKASGCAKAN